MTPDESTFRDDYLRLRNLVDLAPILFYEANAEGRVTVANKTVAQLWGRSVDEIVGRTLDEFMVTQEAKQIMDILRKTINSAEPTTWIGDVVTDASGKQRYLEGYDIPFTDPETGERRVLGIGIDITERHELEIERLEAERIRRDLDIARTIQQSLLPTAEPNIDGYEIAGFSQAAHHAGGDHYDWLPLPDGRLIVTIADVVGHGLGPALCTTACRAYARATLVEDAPLNELVARLNALLVDDLPTDRFVTFAVAILDPKHARIELVSAGHGPILVYRAASATVEHIDAAGPPLSVAPGIDFDPAVSIDLDPGDALLLTSDGLWEWPRADGDRYGIDRLVGSVATHAGNPDTSANSLLQGLRGDVAAFALADAPADDVTAVVVRREQTAPQTRS